MSIKIIREIPTGQPNVSVAICSIDQLRATTAYEFLNLIMNSPYISHFGFVVGTLLPKARNDVIQKQVVLTEDVIDDKGNIVRKVGEFLHSHILFIDDDMTGFLPEHLERMLSHNVDVVGCVAVQRASPHRICVQGGKEVSDKIIKSLQDKCVDKKLIEVPGIGFGFTLIKTEVFTKTVEYTEDGPIWFTTDRQPRKTILKELEEEYEKEMQRPDKNIWRLCQDMLRLGITAHMGTGLVGEDIDFCNRVRMHGFKIYVDPAVVIGHIGDRNYTIVDTLNTLATTVASASKEKG